MERAKGIDTLADAIPRVCDEIAQARFVFVGGDRRRADGSSTRAAIEEKLRPYIEKGQVEIRGSVSDEALVPTYQEADICVVPSELYESFSYTVAQAMACGLPVVASRIGGIPETLGHGDCGLLFEPGSVGGLAENLIDLCRDRAKREHLGLAGRKRAVSEFSAPVVAERTLQVYGTLLSD